MDILNPRAILAAVAREIDIFLGFSWRDWSASIIAGLIFSIGAIKSTRPPHPSIISNYLLLVSWLTPYVYILNLSNQIMGVDEDRINKPDRPIPSGKVTLEGARRRWVVTLSLFLGIAVFERTLLPETICWTFMVAFLSLTSAGNHWFGKNFIAMSVGTWALLSGSWNAIAPATPQSERNIIAVSIWVGLTAHVQDLRDMKGDAVVGRKTLPLVFGDDGSRWIITFLFIPAAFWVLWMGDIVPLAPFTLMAVHIFLGYRIMHAGGPWYDHKTYMIYTYIFCLILALTTGIGFMSDVNKMVWSLAEQSMESVPMM